MTFALRLKFIKTELVDSGCVVHWIVGVSDGVCASTGTGMSPISRDPAGLSEEELLQLAINENGGTALLNDLYVNHANMVQPIVELSVFDDWYRAYEFYASTLQCPLDDKATARQNLEQGFGSYGVTYNHSIFNVTTQETWSHTFAYGVSQSEGAAVDTLYHVKVRNGVVSEWYCQHEALTCNGIPVDWVALDLVSGEVIEYYNAVPSEALPDVTVMNKYDVLTGQLSTSTQHGIPGQLQLPENTVAALSAADFAFPNRVFGYAVKSYGEIVEFSLRS